MNSTPMITSKANAQVREIRRLKQAKYRQARKEYFVEGVRLVEEALQKSEHVLKIAYSPRLEETERGVRLLSLARQEVRTAEWLYASDEVVAAISDTQNHQGILAVLKMSEYTWEDLWSRAGIILLLHELQDPGNLGTIFRTAEAAGAAGMVLSPGTADPHSPKVVRASMGSILRVPFLSHPNMEEVIRTLYTKGYRILAADVHGGPPFWSIDFSLPTAVLLGQEGAGRPPSLRQASDGTFSIPMNPPVESLNVAMAAGLILYEALRQKTFHSTD